MKTKAFKLKQQYKAKPTPIIQKYLRWKFPCRKRAHFRLIHSPFSGEKNLRSKFPSRKRAHIRLINSPFSVEKKEFRRRRKQSQISVNLFISYLNSGLSEFFVNSSICSCFGRDISCYSSIFQVSPESKKRSDLRKRQFSEHSFEDAFDLQSEIFQGNSDVDFSDYGPSNFLEYIIQYTAMSVHIEDEYPNTEVARIEDVDGEEIYQMLRKIERCQVFLPKYAEKFCSISNQQRSQMVQWIIEESSMKGLRDETIFLSIILLGQFVGKGYFRAKRNLQILGIACLTLATWIEEKLLRNSVQQNDIISSVRNVISADSRLSADLLGEVNVRARAQRCVKSKVRSKKGTKENFARLLNDVDDDEVYQLLRRGERMLASLGNNAEKYCSNYGDLIFQRSQLVIQVWDQIKLAAKANIPIYYRNFLNLAAGDNNPLEEAGEEENDEEEEGQEEEREDESNDVPAIVPVYLERNHDLIGTIVMGEIANLQQLEEEVHRLTDSYGSGPYTVTYHCLPFREISPVMPWRAFKQILSQILVWSEEPSEPEEVVELAVPLRVLYICVTGQRDGSRLLLLFAFYYLLF